MPFVESVNAWLLRGRQKLRSQMTARDSDLDWSEARPASAIHGSAEGAGTGIPNSSRGRGVSQQSQQHQQQPQQQQYHQRKIVPGDQAVQAAAVHVQGTGKGKDPHQGGGRGAGVGGVHQDLMGLLQLLEDDPWEQEDERSALRCVHNLAQSWVVSLECGWKCQAQPE